MYKDPVPNKFLWFFKALLGKRSSWTHSVYSQEPVSVHHPRAHTGRHRTKQRRSHEVGKESLVDRNAKYLSPIGDHTGKTISIWTSQSPTTFEQIWLNITLGTIVFKIIRKDLFGTSVVFAESNTNLQWQFHCQYKNRSKLSPPLCKASAPTPRSCGPKAVLNIATCMGSQSLDMRIFSQMTTPHSCYFFFAEISLLNKPRKTLPPPALYKAFKAPSRPYMGVPTTSIQIHCKHLWVSHRPWPCEFFVIFITPHFFTEKIWEKLLFCNSSASQRKRNTASTAYSSSEMKDKGASSGEVIIRRGIREPKGWAREEERPAGTCP